MTAPIAYPALSALSGDVGALLAAAVPRQVGVHARHGRPSNGFLFDEGLILTPAHAVHRDHDLVVRAADGARHSASLAGRDDTTNVAVLKVEALGGVTAVAAAPVAAPGEVVVALGREPQGAPLVALCLVQGAASRLKAWRGQSFESIVRLDRGLPPPFAGAPLFDAAGRLAGMVLAGEWRAAGFAASGAEVLDIARTLVRDGNVARGYLGVMCQAVRLAGAQAEVAGATGGLLVVGLAEGGAADGAGVLVGDVLLRLDDEVVGDVDALHGRLTRERAGSAHRLTILRARTTITIEVTLGVRERRD